MEPLGIRRGGGAGQAWGKLEVVAPAPEPYNSVYPRFCPDRGRAELLGIKRAQREGLVDL